MENKNSNGQIFGGAADLFKSNLLKAYKNRTDKNIFWFDFDGYRVFILKDYDMWQMSIKDPDGDFILSLRAFNCLNIANGDYTCTRWSNAVVDSAVKLFFDTVGEPDEAEYGAELDDMFEYAAEAAEEIETLASQVTDKYEDIVREMESDDPDLENVEYMVDDMYRILVDIENELGECLHRCDERTGCDIGWDDFCTADYFEPIKIYPNGISYSVAEFIEGFNTDAADLMETLVDNIWRGLEGEKQLAFRDLVNDLDLPIMIAA